MAIGGCYLRTGKNHVPSQDSQGLTGAINTRESGGYALLKMVLTVSTAEQRADLQLGKNRA